MMAYHGEGKGEMSFKKKVWSKSFLKLRQIPIARQLDAAPSISHQVALSLRITTTSYFDGKWRLDTAFSTFSRSPPAASSAIIMDSLLGPNPTLASNPSYSFSKAPYNSAADTKEHAFYP